MVSRFILLSLSLLLLFSCGKEQTRPTSPNPGGGNPTSRAGTKIIQDEFEGLPLVLVGSNSDNFMLAFERQLADGTVLDFEPMIQAYPSLFKDNEGNQWDIFGRAVAGPRKGQQLVQVHSYIGFWFAFGTMYPGVELYDGAAYSGDFQQNGPESGWTIPTNHVISSLGIDGIPAVDEPVFEAFSSRDAINNGYFVADDEIVVGIQMDGEIHLYPTSILNWHEIVNDQIGNTHFCMSFCPLTATSIAWDRDMDDGVTTFGISGLLYNSNVMPYDRKTNSFWSQMREDCVRGPLIGQQMARYPCVETTWSTWKKILSSPLVLTQDTGFGKKYDINPYESYINDNSYLSYPVEYDDPRVPRKERVLGVIVNGKAKAYRFKDFE